jgi:hypothetical protein
MAGIFSWHAFIIAVKKGNSLVTEEREIKSFATCL